MNKEPVFSEFLESNYEDKYLLTDVVNSNIFTSCKTGLNKIYTTLNGNFQVNFAPEFRRQRVAQKSLFENTL